LMFVSGALLVTGTTVATVIGTTGRAVRRAGTGTREVARTVRTQRLAKQPDPWGDAPGDEIAINRAEPETFETERLDAEGAEAETVAIPEPDPDDWDEVVDAAPEADQVGEATADAEEPGVTPMGRPRSKDGITESEEVDYKLPPAKALEHGKVDPGPDTRDRDATANALLESLRHFGVEARLLGTVSGPHVSRYELQLAPGTKVSKVAQLRDSHRFRARRRSGSRCRTRAVAWSASARSAPSARAARRRWSPGSARTSPGRR
jgi:FtsK alpha domain